MDPNLRISLERFRAFAATGEIQIKPLTLLVGENSTGKLSGLFTRFDVTKLTPQDSGPFQLKVKVRGRSSTIADVGYGVSQALPLMTDLIEAGPGRSAFGGELRLSSKFGAFGLGP